MRWTSLLRRAPASPAPTARRPSAGRFRLELEWLESRWVPATLLVSPTGLFGSTPAPFTAIQDAVDAASPGDTVLVGRAGGRWPPVHSPAML
jgi:hypothetical protein